MRKEIEKRILSLLEETEEISKEFVKKCLYFGGGINEEFFVSLTLPLAIPAIGALSFFEIISVLTGIIAVIVVIVLIAIIRDNVIDDAVQEGVYRGRTIIRDFLKRTINSIKVSLDEILLRLKNIKIDLMRKRAEIRKVFFLSKELKEKISAIAFQPPKNLPPSLSPVPFRDISNGKGPKLK
jgi:hypothetical protein